MKYTKLGNTNINVSTICLGTMTWGQQNTESQAFEQMDYAIDRSINFFDAAEMYPVPPKAETQGETERIIGNWFKRSGKRDKIIMATKITGRSEFFPYLREEKTTRLNKKQIELAVNNNLKRLQTDYIDLYQLHWPDRKVNNFGQLGFIYDPKDEFVTFQETLSALNDFVKQGKIRYVGLSNETPWGVMEFLRTAKEHDLPRVVSIQNPYSLLNRTFEVGLAEVAIREKVGLLAYSPLAFGVLSGKYLNGASVPNGRITLFERFQRYKGENQERATAKYVNIAKQHGLTPAQMALAFVNAQPFLTSNIIGATTMEQLKENIASIDVQLSADVFAEIEKVHKEIANPCP